MFLTFSFKLHKPSTAKRNALTSAMLKAQKFFAGGKRHRQENGAIPAPHVTDPRANDGSSTAAYPGFGAKTVNSSAENSPKWTGSENRGAFNVDVDQYVTANRMDSTLVCGVDAGAWVCNK